MIDKVYMFTDLASLKQVVSLFREPYVTASTKSSDSPALTGKIELR